MNSALKLIFIVTLAAAASAQDDLPPGPGKDLVQKLCTDCHGLDNITAMHLSKEDWAKKVDDMVAAGAQGTDAEMDQIVTYLAKNFPPLKKVNVNSASAEELAKELSLPDEQAAAIVDYRTKNGNFKQWQDLKNVSGVDMKKIEKSKNRLTF